MRLLVLCRRWVDLLSQMLRLRLRQAVGCWAATVSKVLVMLLLRVVVVHLRVYA